MEICTCRVTRPGVARCATSAKESQRPRRPVSSFAKRWITSVRASTGRGRRSRPLPSASPRPVARALPWRRPGVVRPRPRRGGKRCETGRVAALVGNGQTPDVRRRLSVHSSASRGGRQHTRRCRRKPGPPHVGALQPRGRRLHGGPYALRARRRARQRRGGRPGHAKRTRHYRPKLAALCLEYFRR